MFTARLFLIAKIWKQPKCPLDRQTEWIKKMWYAHTHTHRGVLLSHRKEWNSATAAIYYALWNKSDGER